MLQMLQPLKMNRNEDSALLTCNICNNCNLQDGLCNICNNCNPKKNIR